MVDKARKRGELLLLIVFLLALTAVFPASIFVYVFVAVIFFMIAYIVWAMFLKEKQRD